MYSANPVHDAAVYWDRQYAEGEAYEQAVAQAADEIRNSFNTFSPVPITKVTNIGGRAHLAYIPFNEAVSDAMGYPEVDKAFFEMLHTSKCPKVKAFLLAIAERHVSMNADDIGSL